MFFNSTKAAVPKASRVDAVVGVAPEVLISDAETDSSDDDDDIPLAQMKAALEREQKTFHNDWLKRA